MSMISIIVPVYNAQKTIDRTIKSVLSQSYVDWELILVNDCSTDSTGRILEKYQQKEGRIKVVDKAINEKCLKARIDGIATATSEWVMFLDADDYLADGALASFRSAWSENPDSDVIVGSYNRGIDRFGLLNTKDVNLLPDSLIAGGFDLTTDKRFDLAFWGTHSIPVSLCAKLYKRHLFNVPVLRALPSIHFFEDVLVNTMVFDEVKKITFIKKRIFTYQYGGESSGANKNIIFDLELVYRFRNAILEQSPDNAKVNSALAEYKNTIIAYFQNNVVLEKMQFGKFENLLDEFRHLSIFNDVVSASQDNAFFRYVHNNQLREAYETIRIYPAKQLMKRIVMRTLARLISKF